MLFSLFSFAISDLKTCRTFQSKSFAADAKELCLEGSYAVLSDKTFTIETFNSTKKVKYYWPDTVGVFNIYDETLDIAKKRTSVTCDDDKTCSFSVVMIDGSTKEVEHILAIPPVSLEIVIDPLRNKKQKMTAIKGFAKARISSSSVAYVSQSIKITGEQQEIYVRNFVKTFTTLLDDKKGYDFYSAEFYPNEKYNDRDQSLFVQLSMQNTGNNGYKDHAKTIPQQFGAFDVMNELNDIQIPPTYLQPDETESCDENEEKCKKAKEVYKKYFGDCDIIRGPHDEFEFVQYKLGRKKLCMQSGALIHADNNFTVDLRYTDENTEGKMFYEIEYDKQKKFGNPTYIPERNAIMAIRCDFCELVTIGLFEKEKHALMVINAEPNFSIEPDYYGTESFNFAFWSKKELGTRMGISEKSKMRMITNGVLNNKETLQRKFIGHSLHVSVVKGDTNYKGVIDFFNTTDLFYFISERVRKPLEWADRLIPTFIGRIPNNTQALAYSMRDLAGEFEKPGSYDPEKSSVNTIPKIADDKDKSNVGLIVGVVIGVLIVIAIIVVVIVFILKKKKADETSSSSSSKKEEK